MSLLRMLFGNNNETIPDFIIRTFGFLTKNYGFKIIKTEKNNIYKGDYLVIYRNDNSELQIEICADNSFFHCEIRRLLNGEPAKYSDKENCIGFESLAIIESNNNYDSSAYWANGSLGLKGVLKNTAYLFRRHKTFFTTNSWIDVKKN